jgi:hypothetical protein
MYLPIPGLLILLKSKAIFIGKVSVNYPELCLQNPE